MVCTPSNSIRVLSANCRGLQNRKKRLEVLTYFKETKANIVCLQDTHWVDNNFQGVYEIWGNKCFIHGTKTNARGVAILFNNNFEFEITGLSKDDDGNFLCLTIKTTSMTFNLVTLYGPNTDNPGFFEKIKEVVQKNNPDYYVICGDFNLVLDPDRDCFNYKHVNNPKARKEVLKFIDELGLSDAFRCSYPQMRRYTWRTRNPIKQARLDFFLISNSMLDLLAKCDTLPGYQSDHSIIGIDLIQSKFDIGKGIWKFNNNLLKNADYLELINKTIDDEILKYAIPVYDIKFLTGNSKNIVFTIDHDLFLELLFLRIRGETIKFSSSVKKIDNLKEKQLLQDIEHLEVTNSTNLQLLSDKKTELEDIRNVRLQGQIVRSRMK